jgi:zinc and cadmium transporter
MARARGVIALAAGGHPVLLTLVSVTAISAVPLAALLTLADTSVLRRAIPHLVGLAVGALLGSALLELVPESFARLPGNVAAPALVLAGFLVFFVAERILWQDGRTTGGGHVRPVVPLNFAGVLVHNAVDGMVIAASFLVSIALGLSTALAIFLHEIPHELGDFGIFVQGGLSTRRAALLNFASALGAYGGAIAMLVAGHRVASVANYVMPFAAGNFIYIAAATLIPELRREQRRIATVAQVAAVLAGVLIVALPTLLGHT